MKSTIHEKFKKPSSYNSTKNQQTRFILIEVAIQSKDYNTIFPCTFPFEADFVRRTKG